MQTQTSVIDVVSAGASQKGSLPKGSADDHQFADTLRDHMQAARSPAPHAKSTDSGTDRQDMQEPQGDSPEQQAVASGSNDPQKGGAAPPREDAGKGKDEKIDVAEIAADGNILPLLLPLQMPPVPAAAGSLPAPSVEESSLLSSQEELVSQLAMMQGVPVAASKGAAPAKSNVASPALDVATMALMTPASTKAAQKIEQQGPQQSAEQVKDGADISLPTKLEATPQGSVEHNSSGKEGGFREALQPLMQELPASRSAEPPNAALMAATAPAVSLSSAPGVAAPQQALLTVAAPLHHAQWGSELGERVTWLVRQDIQEAQIQLNPRHLGPIEVRISLQNDQANVQFIAHHGATREAIESALPRLRDMFQDAGLQMGQSSVHSQQSFQQQQQSLLSQGDMGRRKGRSGGEPLPDESTTVVIETTQAPRGIDFYA